MSASPDLSKYLSAEYRLNNLYFVVDKNSRSVPFKLNAVQADVFRNLHKRNLILKARQLGMTTFSVLYYLDQALWQPNTRVGIVSYSLEHAQHILKAIIGHALDNLPKWLDPGIKSRSAREIAFNNGSSIRVDTSLRGGSYSKVLVSEFGKTCARTPVKAEEVVTGTLQTVPIDGEVIIESTGEGMEGYFAEMCIAADKRGNSDLSTLDYHLFFYPWYLEPNYTLAAKRIIETEISDYFDILEQNLSITLLPGQRQWYAHQRHLLGDKIKQEYPSTISEAFLSSSDAFYFAQLIHKAYEDERCLYNALYDPIFPVYVAMDIGVNHATVLVIYQYVHGEVRIIDYHEGTNKGVDYYARHLLYDKDYIYHTIYLPHDARRKDGLVVENSYEKEFKRLFSHTNTRIQVLSRTDKQIQIANAKQQLPRCVFNIKRVKPLLDQCCKYKKKWSEQYGKYLEEPYDGVEADYADALMYCLWTIPHLSKVESSRDALIKHREVVEARKYRI